MCIPKLKHNVLPPCGAGVEDWHCPLQPWASWGRSRGRPTRVKLSTENPVTSTGSQVPKS